LGSDDQLREPHDVRLERAQGIFDGAGHRTQGGLVQHGIDSTRDPSADRGIPDVPFDEVEPLPGSVTHRSAYVVEVVTVSRREVVEADHTLPGAQQRFDQVGSDESGGPGDEPGCGRTPGQQARGVLHHRRQTA
jgi:hypothetical protein